MFIVLESEIILSQNYDSYISRQLLKCFKTLTLSGAQPINICLKYLFRVSPGAIWTSLLEEYQKKTNDEQLLNNMKGFSVSRPS